MAGKDLGDGRVIAIVDDDASVRRSLERLVRSAGYTVETFASAGEFLEWLSRGHAACLLVDVHMNGMSGFDLQERLEVPIIFITAHDDADSGLLELFEQRPDLVKGDVAFLREPTST